jgi:hypothetical protein
MQFRIVLIAVSLKRTKPRKFNFTHTFGEALKQRLGLREEQRLGIFVFRVLRGRRGRVCAEAEIKSRSMRWAEHVICMEIIRNAYALFVRKPKGKRWKTRTYEMR